MREHRVQEVQRRPVAGRLRPDAGRKRSTAERRSSCEAAKRSAKPLRRFAGRRTGVGGRCPALGDRVDVVAAEALPAVADRRQPSRRSSGSSTCNATTRESETSDRSREMKPRWSRSPHSACGHRRVTGSATCRRWLAPSSVKRLPGWSPLVGSGPSRASARRGWPAPRTPSPSRPWRCCGTRSSARRARRSWGTARPVDAPVGPQQRGDRQLVEDDHHDGDPAIRPGPRRQRRRRSGAATPARRAGRGRRTGAARAPARWRSTARRRGWRRRPRTPPRPGGERDEHAARPRRPQRLEHLQRERGCQDRHEGQVQHGAPTGTRPASASSPTMASGGRSARPSAKTTMSSGSEPRTAKNAGVEPTTSKYGCATAKPHRTARWMPATASRGVWTSSTQVAWERPRPGRIMSSTPPPDTTTKEPTCATPS